MKQPRNLEVTVDGSARWRKMYAGVLVRDADTREVLDARHYSLGRGTNNRAEYMALMMACQLMPDYNPGSVVFYTDSQLVFRQLKGEYKVRKAELRSLHRAILLRLKSLQATLRWHRRDEGDGPLADQLASARYKEIIYEITGRNDQGRTGGNAQRKAGEERVRAGERGLNPVENKTCAACRN